MIKMVVRILFARLKGVLVRVRSIALLFRSGVASYRLTGRCYPFSVRILDSRIGFKCYRHQTANVTVRGVISVTSWLGNSTSVIFNLEEGAELRVNGDLLCGPNVRISVGRGAMLTFGGRESESVSGFTENVIILVAKSIEIGKDFLGSWGLFITDADHHQYGESNSPIPVKIGDHVWMCPEASVMKGVSIGPNSVITQKSVVLQGDYPAFSLLAGIPARNIGVAKVWHH